MKVDFVERENEKQINKCKSKEECYYNINKNEPQIETTENQEIYDTKLIYQNKEKLDDYLLKNCPNFYNRFELVELIKSGSAGAVYRGHLKLKNKQNSRQIAFKFLFDNYKEIRNKKTKEQSKNKKTNEMKHIEISIHGVLKHKHIPEIFGYYKIQDNSCIAMEYTKYGDIDNFKKKILKRSSLSESLVIYIAGGILESLYYIHTHNKIIHMDIKQQNVLIDDFLTIKLTDFSVSINYKNAKNTIKLPMVGTCYFMSPEVLNKETILVSEASKIDIYSFGVLLYLLAFCDYPYGLSEVDSKNYPQILKNVKEKELEFPKDTGHSKIFLNFLKNCLNKDIKKRYNIYQAMKDPWFKGYQIILNEKEKLYNAGKFIIDLMVDNFIPFNSYIKELEKNL